MNQRGGSWRNLIRPSWYPRLEHIEGPRYETVQSRGIDAVKPFSMHPLPSIFSRSLGLLVNDRQALPAQAVSVLTVKIACKRSKRGGFARQPEGPGFKSVGIIPLTRFLTVDRSRAYAAQGQCRLLLQSVAVPRHGFQFTFRTKNVSSREPAREEGKENFPRTGYRDAIRLGEIRSLGGSPNHVMSPSGHSSEAVRFLQLQAARISMSRLLSIPFGHHLPSARRMRVSV
jgi:hypothetical protein